MNLMTTDPAKGNNKQSVIWDNTISDDQWATYLEAIRMARKTGSNFLLGGAFGLATYTGRCRNTKDLDFFVVREEKDAIVDALTKIGFDDLHSKTPYDRGWIYRAVKNDVIVDTIWQTPNRRTEVDREWFKRARPVTIKGEELLAVPAEELLAIKLYVIQRDRCDWPDLINLLYATADQLDWEHVFHRLDRELPLLAGLLQVFNWVAPAQAQTIPGWVRKKFCLRDATAEELGMPEKFRVDMIDSRPWFAAFQPQDKPMMV